MRVFRYSASLILLLSAVFALTASTAFASNFIWTNQTASTSLSGLYWWGITSSSDGTKLAAVEALFDPDTGHIVGGIWTSTDGGATWTNQTASTSLSGLYWWGITSSSDGTKLAAAAAAGGGIWTSTNSGATWTDASTTAGTIGLNWFGITSSSDGTKFDAVVTGGDIWTSIDGGQHWTNETTGMNASGLHWFGTTASSDGTKLAAAAAAGGGIWTSTTTGATWTDETTGTSASGKGFPAITSSSDGTKLAAVAGAPFGGDIWTATLSPTLTTSAPSAVFDTSVTLNGSITALGTASSTVRGFVYGSDTSYGATTTESGSFGVGAFSATLSNLTCNTGYHYAAYATNGYLGYGNDQTFTTSACPSPPPAPTVVSSGGGWSGGCSTYPQGELPSWGVLPCTPTNPSQGPPVLSAGIKTSSTSSVASSPSATSSSSVISFPTNHQLYDVSSDIKLLQQFLNTHGFQVSSNGSGSLGNETTFFGMKTYQALIKFQQSKNLPQTGYLGPMTRAALASLSATSTAQ